MQPPAIAVAPRRALATAVAAIGGTALADGEVGKQDEGNDEDAGHGKANVSPKLKPNDLICLPGGVDLVEAKGRVTELLSYCLVHSLTCGQMLLWPVQLEVEHAEFGRQDWRGQAVAL